MGEAALLPLAWLKTLHGPLIICAVLLCTLHILPMYSRQGKAAQSRA